MKVSVKLSGNTSAVFSSQLIFYWAPAKCQHGSAVKSRDPRSRAAWVHSRVKLWHLLAVWPCASYSTISGLTFPNCKGGTIMVPISSSCNENEWDDVGKEFRMGPAHRKYFILCARTCLVIQSWMTLGTPRTVACPAPLSMGFSRQEYWSGLPFPPQGIFLTQGSNPGLLCLLRCWWILYPLRHRVSPTI